MGNVSGQLRSGRSHTQKVFAELLDWSQRQGGEIYWAWIMGPTGHHAAGRAIDLMTLTSNQGALRTGVGNALAAYVQRNAARLGVEYVIWRRRIWNATRSDDRTRTSWSQWRRMEDRGNPTANHEDHVHVSLRDSPPTYRAPSGTGNDGATAPTPPKDWFAMATEEDLKQVVQREVAAQLAPIVAAQKEIMDRLKRTPEITWNIRIPAVGGDSTAQAKDMLAHARANGFMSHHQYVPLMRAIEALAPTREGQAEIRQLATRAVAETETRSADDE